MGHAGGPGLAALRLEQEAGDATDAERGRDDSVAALVQSDAMLGCRLRRPVAERRDQVVDPQLPSCCPGAGPAARSVASIVAALWPLPARVSRAIALASGSSPARMRPVA